MPIRVTGSAAPAHFPQVNTALESTVVRFGRLLIRCRWLVLALSLLVTMLSASGARHLRVENGYRYFFKPDNPYLVAYDKLQNIYSKSENVFFTVAPKSGNVFERSSLAALEELTHEAWQIPHASRVDSVTNFQHSFAANDDIVVEDLVQNGKQLSDEQIQAIRQVALSEPLLRGSLISKDGDVTGVNVNLSLPDNDSKQKALSVARARGLADKLRQQHPDLEIHLTGNAMLNIAFEEAAMRDMSTLTPIMYLVVLVVAGLFLRSIGGVLTTLIVIAAATVSALGVGGYLGIPLTSPAAASLTVIMTLAVSEPIHLIVTAWHEMKGGMNKQDAIVESLKQNFGPLFLTNLTTAIGFLSMNSSDVQPFCDLGNLTTLGVISTFALSVITLPALLAVMPLHVKAQTSSTGRHFSDALTDFVIRYRLRILWTTAALVVIAAVFVPKNRLDDRYVTYFDKSTEFRRATDFTMERLTGLYRLEFSLHAGEKGGVADPAYLGRVEDFANWYRQQPGVKHVQAYTDVVKRLNMNMNGDQPEFYRLPETRDLAAQYQLMYEMSLPYGLDLNDQIDIDKSATRFIVTLGDIPSSELIRLGERGERWLSEHTPAAMHTQAVGQAMMFSRMSESNIKGMLTGELQATILISLTLIFALRSLRLGVLSLLPNLLPAFLAFGIWGALVGQINVAVSGVASICMGIIVDDTVHFMSKYLRCRRNEGKSVEEAIRITIADAGTSLLINTVVLVSGFLVLTLSSFGLNADLGRVTAMVLSIGMLADMLLLPPLLLTFDRMLVKKPVSLEPAATAGPALEQALGSVAGGE